MKLYQINYDLRKQRNYDALYERIRSYDAWCRALESCWMVATHQTAEQIYDYLTPALDDDDGIFVARLKGEAAWRGLSKDASNWVKEVSKQVTP